MTGLAATLALDVRMQARSRLYSIGVTVAVALGLVVRFASTVENAPEFVACFFLLGTGGTTYFFSAALVVMEKSEGTLVALRTTPLTSRAYILSKVVTLVSFAVLESVIVWAIGMAGRDVAMQAAPMFLGLLLLSVFQTFIGLGQVAAHDSITAFLLPGAVLVGGVLQLPFLSVLDVGPKELWYLVPSHAPFTVMLGGTGPLASWQWAYGLGGAVAIIGAAWWWAERRFRTHIQLAEAP